MKASCSCLKRAAAVCTAFISLFVILVAGQQVCGAAEGRVYYVDSRQGDDSNDGLSKENPWKSLAQVNAETFQAGDRILFRAGSVFEGQLKPQGSGRMIDGRPVPIVVDRYGEGERPRIEAGGRFEAALHLHNVEYWEINRLEITNRGSQREAGRNGVYGGRKGVYVEIRDYGTAAHIQLKDLYIHDVNGSLHKGRGSGGIRYSTGGEKQPSRLNGFLVEGCHIKRCERDGIEGDYFRGNTKRGVDWFPSLNVVFRNNLIEEVPGDGIVPVACDGAIVEQNVMRNGTPLPGKPYRAAAGIWPWGCDNTLIQFNEVSDHKATFDGQGFDSDFNCLNTIIQYNYSHDNEGGFLLVCNRGPKAKKYDRTQVNNGTIVRYNVSYNDGFRKGRDSSRIFRISGPVKDTKIYNNVIYVPKGHSNLDMIAMNNWGGPWPTDTWFANNIFYVEEEVSYDWGEGQKPLFEHNLFYGEHKNGPKDPHAITADPRFVSPESAEAGFETLRGFMLQKGSPAIAAGISISPNVDKDLFGHSLPQGLPPCIGVHEFRSGTAERATTQ